MNDTVPIPQKINLTVEEAAQYSNIGQHKIRELLKQTDCDFSLNIGTKTLIKREKFIKYLMHRSVI